MGANRRRFSGTIAMPRPMRWLVERVVTSSPLNVIVPLRERTMPRIVLSVVDLPEALPPSRHTSSPSFTSRLRSWRMWICP